MSFHPLMPYGTREWHQSERVLMPKGEPFAYTADRAAKLEEICSQYPPDRRDCPGGPHRIWATRSGT